VDSDNPSSADSDNPSSATPAKKKEAKKENILIAVGIGGLVLTYLLVRKSSSASTTGTVAATAANPYASSPYASGIPASDYTMGDLSTLTDQVQALQDQLANETPYATSGATTTTNGTVVTPATPTTPVTFPSSTSPSGISPSPTSSATVNVPTASTGFASSPFTGAYQVVNGQAQGWDAPYAPSYITPQTTFAQPNQAPVGNQLAAGYNPALLPYAPVSGAGIVLD
jgi:hypothetical protein